MHLTHSLGILPLIKIISLFSLFLSKLTALKFGRGIYLKNTINPSSNYTILKNYNMVCYSTFL